MKKWLAILFPVQIILFSWISGQQTWIEKIYIPFIFNNIATFLRKITGWFSFSIGLFFIYVFVIFTLYFFAKNIINLAKRKLNYKNFFINVFSYLSIIYGFYMLTWGLVYYRKPIAEIQNLNTKDIRFEEIVDLANQLIEFTNKTRLQIPDNEARANDFNEIITEAKLSFSTSLNVNLNLKYQNPSVKIAFDKIILSYLSTGGIYSFPTGEANINANNTAFEAPFTIYHEMAHQLGFASEEEANFVSFLACVNNPKPIFKYSAYSEAMTYTLNNIYQQDSTLYFQMKSKIDTTVLGDFAYAKAKWKKYQIPLVRKISASVYDLFLKSNNQDEGIKSYGLVVGLLVAEIRKNKSLLIQKNSN
jgi:hypothetical protein